MNTSGTPSSAQHAPAVKRGLLIVSILFGLLVLVNALYFIIKKPVSEAVVAETISQKDQTLEELQNEYDYAKLQLDSLQVILPGLYEKIEEQQHALEAKRAEIETSIRGNGDLNAARQQIAELSRQKDGFLLEIARLKEQVSDLRTHVSTLTSEKEEINSAYVVTSQQLADERAASTALLTEKTKVEKEQNMAREKLQSNAFLKVNAFKISPVMVNNKKTKEKETSKAKSVDRIRICFAIEPNEIVPAGQETFQIRILQGGTTLGSDTPESGIGRDKDTKSDFRYTFTAASDYVQSAGEVCAQWEPSGQTLSKGTYEVDVYNRGRKAGNTSFTLK